MKYAGLQESRTVLTVVPGQPSTIEVSLSPDAHASAAGEVEAVTIAAKREGQAAAIMERRALDQRQDRRRRRQLRQP
ncbi:hypothetical protein ACRAWD_29665 [Caulobacter segnis]